MEQKPKGFINFWLIDKTRFKEFDSKSYTEQLQLLRGQPSGSSEIYCGDGLKTTIANAKKDIINLLTTQEKCFVPYAELEYPQYAKHAKLFKIHQIPIYHYRDEIPDSK